MKLIDRLKSPIKPWQRKLIAGLWIAFGVMAAGMMVFFYMAYNGMVGYMPPVEELKNPHDRFASVIYSADGEELGRYFRNTGNRVYADFDEISQNVIDALISTEDSRFEDHSGIDVRALARVGVKTLLLGQRNAGGGSTITQQLAKQLYSPESHGLMSRVMQKPIEWMIAIKLERFYSKEEIIKMYLNQFDFLYNAVGIKSAAHVYFGKTPEELTVEEAATLVGMVKNPAYYNPVRRPERTMQRRNVVLDQMMRNGKLTAQQADSLKALPLKLDFHRVDHKNGLAPYFREELRRMLKAHRPVASDYPKWDRQRFYDDSLAWENDPLYGWIDKNPKPDGSKYDIYTDGLKIYTTIDSRMQKYAEDAVEEHLSKTLQPAFFKEKRGSKSAPYTTNRTEVSQQQIDRLIEHAMQQTDRYRVMQKNGASKAEIEKSFRTPHEMKVFSYQGNIDTIMTPLDSLMYNKHFLRTGFMAMEPKNGHVKAYVGGPDFEHFQYDMVATGRRQIGSTVKPFLYTYAMEEGFTPCDEFLNEQPVLYDENGRPWAPRNSGKSRIGEMVDLRWALTNSNNWISARLISQLSPASLVRTMHNFGITAHLDPVMSLCLGPADVSVKEMVTAYSAFANRGMRVDPMFVTAITDANGNVLAEFSPRHTEVISEEAYWRILSMLLNVVDSGTGNRIRRPPYNITAQTGGKTGTTNSNSDGWFMAFTPGLVAGTWVGGEERYIHFNSMAQGQGASMALPIYGLFMKKVYADPALPYSQDMRFEFPSGINFCEKDYYGDYVDADNDAEEASFEGVFD
ncbi:transglycosylase domain-containing protein [Paramuribaculum intestinale]|jgi:penicillin-binding protein 1A|uniref:Penicillin-binding protein n=3 Tax=Paramuribaculum intestinale TaxID=2094151 RepID=A0A2V1INU7_9BACT|nr:transglycosylase domain-containing protein [Paramuribaculum intestinale]MBJ2186648.1 penicillin-binding protein [Muribaculaceae bacterium]ROS88984.1 penicillin-binding protein [Muribaculaceae bacterium Isolate-043 (Harlan)]ROT12014.1 penicillin-binding protein [Muribaculaceae bacterium Isolate-105 (HZI)]MCX4330424.1 transglycosylase domain-containing protein [Paramuribaculum intestinale]PWB06057.1 penicillin-binding protein [Paramuribaculum intestinale]